MGLAFSSEDHVTLGNWAEAQASFEGVKEVPVGKVKRAGGGVYMAFVQLKESAAVLVLRRSEDGDLLVRKVTYITDRER